MTSAAAPGSGRSWPTAVAVRPRRTNAPRVRPIGTDGQRKAQPSRGRRADILDAALEVFAGFGYDAARMEHIASLANASIGSVYHHFAGKERLAAALYVEGLLDYRRSFMRALRESGPGGAVTVKALAANHLAWVADNPELAAFVLSSEAGLRRSAAPEVRLARRRISEAIGSWIGQEAARGTVRDIPPELFYAIVIGPAQEFARQWLTTARESKPIEDAEEPLAEAAWRAVRA